MATARSAGVLLYRERAELEVLLVHPGGPFWRNKDAGAWQIPKGGIERDETPAVAALREVAEELGVRVEGTLAPLGTLKQAGGKIVEAFACRQEVDSDAITSITFELEWPPRSGRMRTFPEVDRARWFTVAEARAVMLPSQQPLLDRLLALTAGGGLTGRSPDRTPAP